MSILTGLMTGAELADGKLCSDCTKAVRGSYPREAYSTGTDINTYAPLAEAKTADVRKLLHAKKREQAEIIRRVGSQYSSIAKVESWWNIADSSRLRPVDSDADLTDKVAGNIGKLTATMRERRYSDKIAVTAFIVSGEFRKSDEVLLYTRGRAVEARIIDTFICDRNNYTFRGAFNSHTGGICLRANVDAWIILDVPGGVEEGTLILKK